MNQRLYLCGNVHCQARGSAATKRALEQALWQAGLLQAVEVLSSGCQDHCDHGPNLLVQPAGVRYVAVDAARAATIIREHLQAGQVCTAWLAGPEHRRKPA